MLEDSSDRPLFFIRLGVKSNETISCGAKSSNDGRYIALFHLRLSSVINLFCWRRVCSVGGRITEEDCEEDCEDCEEEEHEDKCKGEKPCSGDGDLMAG